MATGKISLFMAAALALAFSTGVYSQPAPEHEHPADQQANAPCPMYGEGMIRGGRMGMHGRQGMHGMMGGMAFPPGYEKLEMQMHAEMMESMAKIMKKYAAQLPDKR